LPPTDPLPRMSRRNAPARCAGRSACAALILLATIVSPESDRVGALGRWPETAWTGRLRTPGPGSVPVLDARCDLKTGLRGGHHRGLAGASGGGLAFSWREDGSGVVHELRRLRGGGEGEGPLDGGEGGLEASGARKYNLRDREMLRATKQQVRRVVHVGAARNHSALALTQGARVREQVQTPGGRSLKRSWAQDRCGARRPRCCRAAGPSAAAARACAAEGGAVQGAGAGADVQAPPAVGGAWGAWLVWRAAQARRARRELRHVCPSPDL